MLKKILLSSVLGCSLHASGWEDILVGLDGTLVDDMATLIHT